MLQVVVYHLCSACCKIVCLLYGEDIEAYARPFVVVVAAVVGRDAPLALAELAKGVDILHIGAHRVVDILLAVEPLEYALKALTVPLQEHNVEVVIPWNKSLVARSTKQRTRTQPPLYAICITDVCYITQHLQQLQLVAPKLRAIGVILGS